MTLLILAISFGIIIIASVLIRVFRKRIAAWLNNVSMRLQLSTLRNSIHEADRNKETNGRKNIVIFNSVTKQFEPVEKKLLKRMADKNRSGNNAALTKYRKKHKAGGKRVMLDARIKNIEKKSLYVTQ